jgi:hypothetical protein
MLYPAELRGLKGLDDCGAGLVSALSQKLAGWRLAPFALVEKAMSARRWRECDERAKSAVSIHYEPGPKSNNGSSGKGCAAHSQVRPPQLFHST